MKAEVTPEQIMQLGMGFWGSKVLLSAVEFEVFTALGEGPLTSEALRERLGLHARGHVDFLDALVSLGMLERQDGHYANAPIAAVFLDKNKASYIGAILEMANARLWHSWGKLSDALRTGKPQSESGGSDDVFDTLYSDPARLEQFLRSMTAIHFATGQALARKFPWKNYKTCIDIGTAQGGVIVEIARENRHITGGGFDLPQAKPIFEAYVQAQGMADRLKFHTGDFFKEPIPHADVITMGHILHNWNLDEKKVLIRKAYEALPEGGAFVVFESLIDDERRHNAVGLLMSLNMLIETPGGFDFTGADCRQWLKEAGFRETRIEHLQGPESMVVGIK